MSISPDNLISLIHAAPGKVVFALNGGSGALAELLTVPGGSKTVLEATVPYSERSLTAWLGSRPEQFCSSRTARAMAVAAFFRALRYGAGEQEAAGVACSAALATDRPKRGAHRAHVAIQTADVTRQWSLELEKGARSRQEEESLVARMVLNAVGEACGVRERVDLPLLERERLAIEQAAALPAWRELFLGRMQAVQPGGDSGLGPTVPQVIFAGAFNPLHAGHRRMAEIAKEVLSRPIAWEISVVNVDKPVLDYLEIEHRLRQFPPPQGVWLTRAATFEEKSRLFPGATFIVGIDTLRRITDPHYYGDQVTAMALAIEQILTRGCRFLVFGRAVDPGFVSLSDIDLPDSLRRACSEIPLEKFRADISSTELRMQGVWSVDSS